MPSISLNTLIKHVKGKPYEIPEKNGKNFIDQLPREILSDIFIYLDNEDHLIIKTVCKLWHQILLEGLTSSDYHQVLQIIEPVATPVHYKIAVIRQRILIKEFTLYGKWNPNKELELKCNHLATATFAITLHYSLLPLTAKNSLSYVDKICIECSNCLTLPQVSMLKKVRSQVMNQIMNHIHQICPSLIIEQVKVTKI